MSSTQPHLKAELQTISLFISVSTIPYLLYRSMGYIGIGGYNYNLLNILDYAVATKRFAFIQRLTDLANQLPKNSSKEQFAKLLLQCFQEETAKYPVHADMADLKVIKKYINRYLDDNKLNYHISKNGGIQAATDQKNIATRKSMRTKKIWLTISAIFLAVFVAIPEAALPVYALGVFTIANLISVGLPAFIISYLLFKQDIYRLLKDSSADTPAYKTIFYFLITCVSLTFACLCFNSIYTPFAAIFPQLIAFRLLVTIFFSIVAFIANLALLRSTAINAYKEMPESFSKRNYAWAFVMGATIILAQYWIYTEVLKLLQGMFGLANHYNVILSAAMSAFSALFGVFYARSLYHGLNSFSQDYINSIKNLINNLWQHSSKNANLESKYNAVNITAHLTLGLIIFCAVINAQAIGIGILSIMGASRILQFSGAALIGAGSFFGNTRAAYDEIKLPEQPKFEPKSPNPADSASVCRYICYKFKYSDKTTDEKLVAEEFSPAPARAKN